MELAQSSLETDEKYLEMFEKECTVLRKKLEMVLCKGYGSIFMEISDIFGDFADAEEHDAWKRWMSSDECFEAMTV